MSEWKSAFHKRINDLFTKEKDRDHRVTYEEYANKLNTTRSALRGWLAGAGEPKSEKLREIAEIENVSSDWLIGITDDPRPHIEKNDSILAAHKENPFADVTDEEARMIEAVLKAYRNDPKNKK